MMECARCHAVIADKAIVCYRCGTPTAVPEAPTRPATRAARPWTLILVLLVAAVVSGGVAWSSAGGSVQQVSGSLAGVALVTAAAYLLWRRGRTP
jgi:hypothetical protein